MPPTGAIGHTTHTVSNRSRRPDVGRSTGCTRPAGCELHLAWPTRAVLEMSVMSADLALTVTVNQLPKCSCISMADAVQCYFKIHTWHRGGGGAAAAADL